EGESIAVPVEGDEGFREPFEERIARGGEPDAVEADLAARGTLDAAAEGGGEELAAEADTEDRQLARERSVQERELVGEVRDRGRVADAGAAAEDHEAARIARVARHGLAREGPDELHLAEVRGERPQAFARLVLD